ncbi:MAG: hypothetical protein ACD_7C00367G0001 [uncultured bacterium]|nr:MAG: hypothetical protein ACD_7C00367G0001 [uncultured bacterium]
MKKDDALKKAVEIGTLITNKSYDIEVAVADMPFTATLPIIKRNNPGDPIDVEGIDLSSLDPHIFEVIIFGSVAQDKENVGDIDIIVIDGGYFSTVFSCVDDVDDWYSDISNNLFYLLTEWLYCSEEEVSFITAPTDVHIFPLKMLKNKSFRQDIAQKHSDPCFLQNAFSSILRFDGKAFVPIDVAYLENKYETDLSDLKK